ncbi:MAG: Flp pilus assembly complex ATPase component TadA [Candidatus Pacebacteria bacterium]|nr:Flp pilus assembly complex ATPase component TadA [Candidatus Paceibacterota bacterium]
MRQASLLLGEILIETGDLTAEDLERALASQDGSNRMLGDILVDMGLATEEQVARALAVQLNIPFFEPDDDFRLEREEVELIPEALARKYSLIPVKKTSEPILTIVMRDPIDLEAIDAIRSLTTLRVRKAVSTWSWIKRMIDKFYSEEAYVERSLQDVSQELAMDQVDEGFVEPLADAEQLRVLANDAPVVRFVNLLFMEAVRDRASDIHIEPEERKVRVRLRVDGRLRETTPPPKNLHQAIVTRIKILSNMDIAERRLPLDGRLKFKVQDRIIDVRVSSMPEVYGEKVVMRILDRAAMMSSMGDIGMEDDMLRRFKAILRMPNGIILLTGPTGSGKTSTLYSALNYLKSPELNIQTVEDPVEYMVGGVNQMQIRPTIGLSFANALRSILRQDPDIIMIGEIRDLDTARIAMQASLTGHLVLSTLHTNDSPSAFNRLKDLGLESYLIAATINLVMSQRLVRLICDRCRKPVQPSPEQIRLFEHYLPGKSVSELHEGKGCPACANTGFYGRTGIIEFLEVSNTIRDMVVEGASTLDIRRTAMEEGMEPLVVSGLRKARDGVTTVEEAMSVCQAQPE